MKDKWLEIAVGLGVTLFLAILGTGLMMWKTAITREDVDAILAERLRVYAPVSADDLTQLRALSGDVTQIKIEQIRSSVSLESKLSLLDAKLELIKGSVTRPDH